MSFFDWSDRLDIKVESMNREHRHLLEIMNRLFDANEQKADKSALKTLVKELGDYTVKHFADEEAYLASISFPDIEKHKFIHKDLLTKFGGHVANFEKAGTLDAGFFDFLKMWLNAHIQGIDMKYGEFANKKT